jgi:hypothetical protein
LDPARLGRRDDAAATFEEVVTRLDETSDQDPELELFVDGAKEALAELRDSST